MTRPRKSLLTFRTFQVEGREEEAAGRETDLFANVLERSDTKRETTLLDKFVFLQPMVLTEERRSFLNCVREVVNSFSKSELLGASAEPAPHISQSLRATGGGAPYLALI